MVPVRQVTVDPPAHDLVRHLELVPLLDEVFPGKRTPNSLDHSAQYRIDIFLRIPEDLEPIACRVPVLEFEGLQCNVLTGQMCVEVTPVRTAGEVRGSHGFEAGVLEVFQADPIGDLDIEAPGAEQALAVFQGSVVNCIVALGGFATNLKLNGVQFGCPFR